ncbi:MAG: hypothetical protein HN712_17850 [Gemmatimonadetes bacterium]|nr:hypothetical protein [Gemmatimonadota bacterium]MBT6149580.1 hypothetical protein [Gemmatimonadota bacterium]MBT7862186.1 hypothetical protein [Gemmatimonadota bacterium]
MARFKLIATAMCAILVTSATANAQGRGLAAAEPPIEPSMLFSLPTGAIVQSMDLDVHGSGVLFSGAGSRPLGGLTLGLGDIAQMEVTTMSITSDIEEINQLVGVPAAGLKVSLRLTNYAQGIAASFQRSGTFTQFANKRDYEGKAGEFYVMGTVANYARPEHATEPAAGWRGLKIRSHIGMKYMDAQLRSTLDDEGGATQSTWRPVVGFELWRDDARARVIGELNYITGISVDGLGENEERVEAIRTLTGGVRFFFSKHVTFDIGVRHQSNYDGLAESAIQSRLNFSLPTHVWRDRVVGN